MELSSKTWFITAFLSFALFSVVVTHQPTHRIEMSVRGPVEDISPQFTPEQERLIDYLSRKYQKSQELVQTAVKVAYEQAAMYGLPPTLILAIIEQESGFRHEVVNGYGAVGLMQVVPRYHKEKLATSDGNKELQNPETNIRVGSQILYEYLQKHGGDLAQALKKYSGNAKNYFEKVSRFEVNLKNVARTNEAQEI